MIKNIAISGISAEVTTELEKYINKKVGKLDKFLPRDQREAVRADVKLKESVSKKTGKKCSCEVILHVPGARLTAEESTVNMFAAVDIVETKLQNQLKKHTEKHSSSQDKRMNARARRALGKLKRPRFRR